ncbi:MAG: hypothetical protein ACI9YB_001953 [Halioglobus sp.]|jgi:hypothetical protein
MSLDGIANFVQAEQIDYTAQSYDDVSTDLSMDSENPAVGELEIAGSEFENAETELDNNETEQAEVKEDIAELEEKIERGEGEPGDEEKLEELKTDLEDLETEHEALEATHGQALEKLSSAVQKCQDLDINVHTLNRTPNLQMDRMEVIPKSQIAASRILIVPEQGANLIPHLEAPSRNTARLKTVDNVGANAVDNMALLQVLMIQVLKEASEIQKSADAVETLIKAEKFAIGLVAAGHRKDAAIMRASKHFTTAATNFVTYRAGRHANKMRDLIDLPKNEAKIGPEKPTGAKPPQSVEVKVSKKEKTDVEKRSSANRTQTKDNSKKLHQKTASLDQDVELSGLLSEINASTRKAEALGNASPPSTQELGEAALSPKPPNSLSVKLMKTLRGTGKKNLAAKALSKSSADVTIEASSQKGTTPPGEGTAPPGKGATPAGEGGNKTPSRDDLALDRQRLSQKYETKSHLMDALDEGSQFAFEMEAIEAEFRADLDQVSQESFRHTSKGMKKSIKEINEFYNTMIQALGKVSQIQSDVTNALFKQSKG